MASTQPCNFAVSRLSPGLAIQGVRELTGLANAKLYNGNNLSRLPSPTSSAPALLHLVCSIQLLSMFFLEEQIFDGTGTSCNLSPQSRLLK